MPDDDNGGSDIEQIKASCEVIRELVGRVLTLSTALIAVEVGFARIVGVDKIPDTEFIASLVSLSVAIVFGLLTLMTIVSSLANGDFDAARNKWVMWMSGLQLLSFLVGIGSMILMAFAVA